MSTVVSTVVVDELASLGELDVEACMNCGVCTAACPLGIDVLPRRLARYAVLGMRERLYEEEDAIFSCLLCRSCEVNCPAGVHITENIRLLRRWMLQAPGGMR